MDTRNTDQIYFTQIEWNENLLAMQEENISSMRNDFANNIRRIMFAILDREGPSRAANQEIRNMVLNEFIPLITDIDTRRRNAQNTGDINTIVRIQNQLTSELFRLASTTRVRAIEAEEALAQAQQRIT